MPEHIDRNRKETAAAEVGRETLGQEAERKISQRLYSAIRSANDGLVVCLMPRTMDLNLLKMAIPTPVST